jgi:hypothetical protein
MADPLGIAVTANTWTKIATNVTVGKVWLLSGKPQRYYVTYRDTGGTAPTGLPAAEDAIGFDTIDEEGSYPSMPISAGSGIDVYIYPTVNNGKVRVDL